MYKPIEITNPVLARLEERYTETKEFCSFFFRAYPNDWPDFGRGWQHVLTNVLESSFIREHLPVLFPLDMEAAMRFTRLNTYEFEGSLINLFGAEGGYCDLTGEEPIARSVDEYKNIIQAILHSIPGSEEYHILAYRMDDWEWSAMTRGATEAYSFFAYFPKKTIWWFVAFAHFY